MNRQVGIDKTHGVTVYASRWLSVAYVHDFDNYECDPNPKSSKDHFSGLKSAVDERCIL